MASDRGFDIVVGVSAAMIVVASIVLGFLVWSGEANATAKLGGVGALALLAGGALVFASLYIRCPRCGSRWFRQLGNRHGQRAGRSAPSCPSCGLPEGYRGEPGRDWQATSKGMRVLSGRRKFAAAALMIIGAGLVIVAALAKTWWSIEEFGISVHIGMISLERCIPTCETLSMIELGEQYEAWITAGRFAFGLALVMAVLLVASCARSLIGRRQAGPVSPARITLLVSVVAIAASIAFVVLAPDDGRTLKLGLGPPMLLGGALIGSLGAFLSKPHVHAPFLGTSRRA